MKNFIIVLLLSVFLSCTGQKNEMPNVRESNNQMVAKKYENEVCDIPIVKFRDKIIYEQIKSVIINNEEKCPCRTWEIAIHHKDTIRQIEIFHNVPFFTTYYCIEDDWKQVATIIYDRLVFIRVRKEYFDKYFKKTNLSFCIKKTPEEDEVEIPFYDIYSVWVIRNGILIHKKIMPCECPEK